KALRSVGWATPEFEHGRGGVNSAGASTLTAAFALPMRTKVLAADTTAAMQQRSDPALFSWGGAPSQSAAIARRRCETVGHVPRLFGDPNQGCGSPWQRRTSCAPARPLSEELESDTASSHRRCWHTLTARPQERSQNPQNPACGASYSLSRP